LTWNLSCPDWRERLLAGRSLVPDLPLYRAEADRSVAIFNKLRLFDVHGTPTMAEAGADWFRDIVRALFGSYDAETRVRHIRELFLLIPKKNNKTTGGALLMLTALLLNQRPRAPFLLTAPVQKTAEDAFAALAGAIALDPVLDATLHVRDHLKTVVHRVTKAQLQIMTFDPEVLTGKKVVGGLIDELHVLGKMARASKAMLQLRGGMQPFPEAFLVTITTQSDEAPTGVFKEDLLRAREIRDGKRTGATLPVLYEFPQELQQDATKPWREPANWGFVNPNLGRSVHLQTLIDAFADAEAKGEAALREWASQHLNIEIGLALHSHRWAGADYWEAAGDEKVTLDALIERSEVVTFGIDGGGLDDLLGASAIGRERETGKWLHWAKAWAHPAVLERRKDIVSRLRDLEKDGDLVIVEKMGDDVTQLVDVIERINDAGLLDKIGVDPAGIGSIIDEIVARKLDKMDDDEGNEVSRIAGISQGWKLNGAIKTTERKLVEGGLIHGSRPLMTWCVGNAKVEPRGNAIIITKQASGNAKIDPLMATFNAVTLMSLNPSAKQKSFQFFVVG
jgi:phage terminase large subunit-like protein